jgi:hypothetical protein
MTLALDAPRAGRAAAGAGLYESHYLKAVDPAGGRAVWLRQTVHKEPGQAPRTTVWLTWFDRGRGDDAVVARRVEDPDPYVDPTPARVWSASSLGTFGPDGAIGALEERSWEFTWTGSEPPVPYLPKPWLYDRKVPRSNGVALHPDLRVTGVLVIDGEEITLEGWPGMIGHNWGIDHAEHWVWTHAAGIGPGGSSWYDLALARVPLPGGRTSGWLATGAAMLDGSRRPVSLRGATLDVRGEEVTVGARVAGGGSLTIVTSLPSVRTVVWDYDSPGGGRRDVRNCSIADATVTLGGPTGSTITVDGALALELGVPG